MTKSSCNNVKIPSQRVDSCLQPLGIIPGKAQFYHRKWLLHPSLPQQIWKQPVYFIYFWMWDTQVSYWSVWHGKSYSDMLSIQTHPKTLLLPLWGRRQCPGDHTPLPGSQQRPHQPGVLHMAPGQEATSAQVSARLKYILNASLN